MALRPELNASFALRANKCQGSLTSHHRSAAFGLEIGLVLCTLVRNMVIEDCPTHHSSLLPDLPAM